MKTFIAFTTEDADRLLDCADRFLASWREAFDSGETKDDGIIAHERDWKALRPIFLHAPAMLAALQTLRQDLLMLQSGEWVPDEDSIQASLDVIASAIDEDGGQA